MLRIVKLFITLTHRRQHVAAAVGVGGAGAVTHVAAQAQPCCRIADDDSCSCSDAAVAAAAAGVAAVAADAVVVADIVCCAAAAAADDVGSAIHVQLVEQ